MALVRHLTVGSCGEKEGTAVEIVSGKMQGVRPFGRTPDNLRHRLAIPESRKAAMKMPSAS
jgi:hypothetical protein